MMKLKLIVTAALFMTLVNAGIIGYSMEVADESEKVSYPATDNKNLTNCHTWQNYLTQKL